MSWNISIAATERDNARTVIAEMKESNPHFPCDVADLCLSMIDSSNAERVTVATHGHLIGEGERGQQDVHITVTPA
jgi:hypothetical protein